MGERKSSDDDAPVVKTGANEVVIDDPWVIRPRKMKLLLMSLGSNLPLHDTRHGSHQRARARVSRRARPS